MKDIAIFGAGGFGREVACLIKRINEKEPTWRFIGFFDDNEALLKRFPDATKAKGKHLLGCYVVSRPEKS